MSVGEAEIWQAAEKRLEDMTGLVEAVNWPNETEIATLPRYEVRRGPAATRDRTYDGMARIDMTMIVTAVVQAGGHTDYANGMVTRVVDRFFSGALMTGTNARVLKRPVVGGAYTDGTKYRVPITITIRAHITR